MLKVDLAAVSPSKHKLEQTLVSLSHLEESFGML